MPTTIGVNEKANIFVLLNFIVACVGSLGVSAPLLLWTQPEYTTLICMQINRTVTAPSILFFQQLLYCTVYSDHSYQNQLKLANMSSVELNPRPVRVSPLIKVIKLYAYCFIYYF